MVERKRDDRPGNVYLSDEDCAEQIDDVTTFKDQILKILESGWHDPAEERFAKFELLRGRFNIEAIDTLAIVREAKNELIKAIESKPQNTGGHTSDHYTWHQNGLEACNLILARYER